MPAPGPAALGRGVVIQQGSAVPGAWRDAPVVVVDEAAVDSPGACVADLHQAWAARRPVVIALGVDASLFREPRCYPVEPWTLDAAFEVDHDRLTFLVWANTYDARGEGDPIWWWARKAERLGATIGGSADLVLPDGRPAWIDGGPRGRGSEDDGDLVVHRETVDLGRLDPVPPWCPPAAELAADQLAAVAHDSGPARVIAPAGSGKTRVLTERLRHLIVDRGVERETVLAVAYNVKAREEMATRTATFSPRIQSLNALGYALVREARGTAPPVLDEREVRRLVEGVMPRRRRRANVDPYAVYLEGLSAIRLGLRDPAEVEASLDDAEGLADGFGPYRRALAEAGALDFDEQIYAAVEVLLSDGVFRRRAQQRCRHLLVDEFQDLTPAHVLLVRLLAAPALDVFGVGDDDQVIYGHAGADPAFLIGFEDMFPGAASHPLEVNYRCPVAVVDAARTLLSYNLRRVDKVIRAGPAAAAFPDGLVVRIHGPGDGARLLVGVVQGWLGGDGLSPGDGVSPGAVAVLARVNSLLLAPHVALVEAGVPVESSLGTEVLRRTGMRAALAYLRIGAAPERIAGADVVEILRRPSRGFPPWFAERLGRRNRWTLADLSSLANTVPDNVAAKVEGLVADLARVAAVVAKGDTGAALAVIRDEVGLGRAMTLLDGGGGGEGSSNIDDLDALAQVAALHRDPAGFEPWLRSLLDRPQPGATDGGAVTLSTVHRVKGREWDRVVVFGVTAGVLPHRLADDEEEERRVFHVALTRGRHRVVVMGDQSRRSEFLAELEGRARHRPQPEPGAPAGQGPIAARRGSPAATGRASPATALPELTADAARREEALRVWRTQRCGQDKVPAYIVLSNSVLRAIARRDPRRLEDLAGVVGIGPAKLDRYGDEIIAVLDALGCVK